MAQLAARSLHDREVVGSNLNPILIDSCITCIDGSIVVTQSR